MPQKSCASSTRNVKQVGFEGCGGGCGRVREMRYNQAAASDNRVLLVLAIVLVPHLTLHCCSSSCSRCPWSCPSPWAAASSNADLLLSCLVLPCLVSAFPLSSCLHDLVSCCFMCSLSSDTTFFTFFTLCPQIAHLREQDDCHQVLPKDPAPKRLCNITASAAARQRGGRCRRLGIGQNDGASCTNT